MCRKMHALIGVIKNLIYCYVNLLILIFSLNIVSCQADGGWYLVQACATRQLRACSSPSYRGIHD